ncbi:helix-turn-helix domain-containing protein [Amycolatopsis oliviviridis]|uniref:AraC family transcriptional regulator n=1 Tax=Amycolatopsis oliviviridis TaxID=1471590 RepID=A0ABQ3LZW1_9PSEU|nr:AraC family transcriptional regulator [Amycolatopsis oliviviridis]GHH30353.1 AraC family transcriptional regulator [Amycolatopsis oliviviridis]
MAYRTWMRYFTPSAVHRRLGLVCLGVGLQHGALPVVGPRVLDHYVAVVVSKGRGWFAVAGGERQEVVAPALLWLVPGVGHHYAPDPGQGWEECFVDFDGSAVDAYVELGYVTPGTPVVPLGDVEAVRDIVSRIVRCARGGSPLAQVDASAAVHHLLVALRRASAGSTPSGGSLLEALARDALLPISVAEIAARRGMTLPELRAAVRRSTESGLKDHLLTLRLNRAKELLATTRMPVQEVAQAIGYEDAAYFSRLFTRRVGVSPGRFRESRVQAVPGGWSSRVPPPDDPPLVPD